MVTLQPRRSDPANKGQGYQQRMRSEVFKVSRYYRGEYAAKVLRAVGDTYILETTVNQRL
jgi:hypothetical protein